MRSAPGVAAGAAPAALTSRPNPLAASSICLRVTPVTVAWAWSSDTFAPCLKSALIAAAASAPV